MLGRIIKPHGKRFRDVSRSNIAQQFKYYQLAAGFTVVTSYALKNENVWPKTRVFYMDELNSVL